MVNLAALDILRDRERGVPRYNDFRALLDMPRIERFADLTADPELAREIEAIYGGDIDKVNTLVGCLAETPSARLCLQRHRLSHLHPDGVAAAEKRPLLTTDFTPEIYTEEGMRWVMDTTFTDVLRRHFPAIASAPHADKSPFSPWDGPAH